MSKIAKICAREILDSRGNPTLETKVVLRNGVSAVAAVPCGASTGEHEAKELRDNNSKRYHGKGVKAAVDVVNGKIQPLLLNFLVTDQEKIDNALIQADGTENKKNLGANSILSVSLACARTGALSQNLPLWRYIAVLVKHDKIQPQNPVIPMFNVINGGLHGCGNFNFQEFLLIPASNLSFPQSLRLGSEIYQSLKLYLKKEKLTFSVGDEGGFTPDLDSNQEVLQLLKEVIGTTKYLYGKDVFLGLDFAASEFYQNKIYHVSDSNSRFTTNEFIDFLQFLQKEYGLFSLEDPLDEDDWEGWRKFTEVIGKNALVIGDDLLVTNIARLKRAVTENACNSILIKPNQIGTLSETLAVIEFAKRENFKVVISHRSGETNDDFIADLAVGVGADFVKFGAPARGERVAKYNRLLEIYREL